MNARVGQEEIVQLTPDNDVKYEHDKANDTAASAPLLHLIAHDGHLIAYRCSQREAGQQHLEEDVEHVGLY